VHEVAKRLSKDLGQVLVIWGVQRGHIVQPKSNFQDFELSAKDIAELNALEHHKRLIFPVHWGFNIFDKSGEDAVKKATKDVAESIQV
jgi:hypothetical protein